MDLQGDDLFVVRSVEDADATALWRRLRGAPQEVVVELLARWLLERDHLHALRVHAGHDVLDRGVLPCRVDGLEHDEQRVPVAGPQELLRVAERFGALGEHLLGLGVQLIRGEVLEVGSASPGRVAPGDVRHGARLHEQLCHHPLPPSRLLRGPSHQASMSPCRRSGERVHASRERSSSTVPILP